MRRQALIGIFALACLAPAPAVAQQGTAELRGRVADQQGGTLPGVTIVVRNEQTGMFRQVVSGADGSFLLSAMNPGRLRFSVPSP